MSEHPWNEKNNRFTWLSSLYNSFKRQPHRMVKHTQTIRRLTANELFKCLTILWEWRLKG